MRYFVFTHTNDKGEQYWSITLNYGGTDNTRGYYGVYDTEREAIEKCEKLNAMLYPQPYIFIER